MQPVQPEQDSVLWHSITSDCALKRQASSCSGLSQNEASDRLAKYGENRLPQTAKRSDFMRFLLHFHNILIYVLLACTVVTAALEHWVDTRAGSHFVNEI